MYCQYTKPMSQIKFDLRKALDEFEARTGMRLTYETLSNRTGLAVDTLKSIATRDDYQASLKNIASICDALKSNPIEYLVWIQDSGEVSEN